MFSLRFQTLQEDAMLTIIISSLLSGLVGIFISSRFYSNLEKRRLKIDTVKRLLGNRHNIAGEDFTKALNEAFIIFADNKKVVKAIKELDNASTTPGKPDINNKLLSLFKAVCKDAKCLPKNIDDRYFLRAFS